MGNRASVTFLGEQGEPLLAVRSQHWGAPMAIGTLLAKVLAKQTLPDHDDRWGHLVLDSAVKLSKALDKDAVLKYKWEGETRESKMTGGDWDLIACTEHFDRVSDVANWYLVSLKPFAPRGAVAGETLRWSGGDEPWSAFGEVLKGINIEYSEESSYPWYRRLGPGGQLLGLGAAAPHFSGSPEAFLEWAKTHPLGARTDEEQQEGRGRERAANARKRALLR